MRIDRVSNFRHESEKVPTSNFRGAYVCGSSKKMHSGAFFSYDRIKSFSEMSHLCG